MNLLQTLLSKKGQFVNVKYEKPVKQLKDSPNKNVVKSVSLNARAGVEYDNIKAVKEKREIGELPEVNAGLPYGVWIHYPYVLEHKGKQYARFSLGTNNNPKVVYFIDGKEVSQIQALEFALSSEKPKENIPDVLNISLDNIISIQ